MKWIHTLRKTLNITTLPLAALAFLFLLIIALLPFHAFISTWAISNFGLTLLFKSWKEALLIFVALPLSVYILATDKNATKLLITNHLNQFIFAYFGINILLAVFSDNPTKVVVAGLVFNLRFLMMFLLAQLLALKLNNNKLQEIVLRIIFWGGVAVVTFGALQATLLPNDFLRHFGYRQSIIPPYFTVDNNESIVRILSTLRGPNALGAYLAFWLPILALVTKRMWNVANKYRIISVVIWALSILTLYASRSRSGWLAAAMATVLFILLSVNAQLRKRLLIGGASGVIFVAIILIFSWNTAFVQTTLKHRDPSEQSSINSDNQRSDSLHESIIIIHQNLLFGTGTGSVNLASTYGPNARIVENYYLQIGQELGVIGLAVLASISVLVALKLWRLRYHDIAAALFASFIGIFVVNMLLPGWGDETLSMLWWGFAGLVLIKNHAAAKRRD